MDFNLYKKCIDEISTFPDKVKVIRFVGIGEPLMHKNIVDMVAYTSQKNVTHTIEMLTNASLLTHEMTDKLIAAGLNRLVVSLQGTSKEKYMSVSGINIDFDKFIDNLRYFYKHKGTAQMYIKIIDCALDDKADEQRFYDIFGDICDTIAIEHAVPIHSGVDYENVLKETHAEVTQFGLPVADVKICPQPFFHLQINPDGKVVPCYSFEYPAIIGDCNTQTIPDIWNGRTFNDFRCKMLEGSEYASKVCPDCKIMKYRLFPEDMLNNDAERLKQFYK